MDPNAAGSSLLQNAGGSSTLGITPQGSGTIQPASSSQSVAVGGIGGNAGLTPQSVSATGNNVSALTNQNNAQLSSLDSLLQSIQAEEQANVPGVAPTLNLNALNAQAQSQAQNTVNPLYTQYLNEYNQELSADQQAAQSQNTLNLQSEQAALGNTLAQNTQAQTYAGQENAATQGNINAEAQNYQLQSGNAQTAKVQAISSQLGSGNLGASGMGQQQLWQAENTRNIADAAQQGQYQYQRNTSNLSTADTFAQLAQSSLYAQTGETEQEAQTNFNLNDYLRQAAANDTAYTQQLQASQQLAQTAQAQNILAQEVQSALSAANPTGSKNYAAGETAYAPQLQTSSLPTAPDLASALQNLNFSSAV